MQIKTIPFIFGLSVGLVCAFMITTVITGPRGLVLHSSVRSLRQQAFQGHESIPTHKDMDKIQQIIQPMNFQDSHSHHDDDEIAQGMKKNVRIFCWIMTSPNNLQSKAIHVKKTWAHRCNKYIFISSEKNDTFPTVGIDIPEGREHLTAKTMKAFTYIYENHFDDADWFIKADDDTYVILENLRYFLSGENKSDPVYFGHHFGQIVKQGYFSGGAGYVISKEALRRFGERSNDSMCLQDGGSEDVEFGICMEKLGVKVGNASDSLGRSRFHCFDPETHLRGEYPDWYFTYDSRGAPMGRESISDYAISFHYVSPAKMYSLEYFIYHLRPYGIQLGLQDMNKKH